MSERERVSERERRGENGIVFVKVRVCVSEREEKWVNKCVCVSACV